MPKPLSHLNLHFRISFSWDSGTLYDGISIYPLLSNYPHIFGTYGLTFAFILIHALHIMGDIIPLIIFTFRG